MKIQLISALCIALISICSALYAAEPPKPIKALLITGGAAHDYRKQKDILKKGIEERGNIAVELLHCDDKSMKPVLPFLDKPEMRRGYDVIVYDVCAPGVNSPEAIAALLKPHQEGVPAVLLHASTLSFHSGNLFRKTTLGDENSRWHELIGVQCAMHGPQAAMSLSFADKSHPIIKSFEDWTTIPEELYPVLQVLPTAKVLANAEQTQIINKKQPDGTEKTESRKDQAAVAWTNIYRHKTRVFATSVGHNTKTVEDPRYLDLVTNGLLWVTDKLDADGNPKSGYAAGGK